MQTKLTLKKLNKILFLFTVLIVTIFFHQDIHAREVPAIEIEKIDTTISEIEDEFKLRIAKKYWYSEGSAIENFDISETNVIAISFTNNSVGVFDENMNYLFGVAFELDEAHGVFWENENILLYALRKGEAVSFNKAGEITGLYRVTGRGNYYPEIIDQPIRVNDQSTYFLANYYSLNLPGVKSGSYSMLKKKDQNGNESVLYEADRKIDGYLSYAIVMVLIGLFLSAYIIFIFSYAAKKRKA